MPPSLSPAGLLSIVCFLLLLLLLGWLSRCASWWRALLEVLVLLHECRRLVRHQFLKKGVQHDICATEAREWSELQRAGQGVAVSP